MTNPITPDEARELHHSQERPPDLIFEVFNDLIIKHLHQGRAHFSQNKVKFALVERHINVGEAFAERWLDVEPYYREAGWRVTYDKPGYNETYDATFTFERES